MNKSPNTPLFFILGRERSGTTMLRVTLNNHPNIHILPESPFIIHLYKKYYGKKNIDLKEFIKDLREEPFLTIWKIDYKILFDRLQKAVPSTFSNYCKIILNQNLEENVILGDKNPTNSLFGKTLHKIFPEAKFIWIIRDYRAQVNSMLKVNFEKKIVSSLAIRWVSYNKKISELKTAFPSQVLLMKYEDLVLNPENNYKLICEFLSIEYDNSVLKTDNHHSDFFQKHHVSLTNEINTSHIEEWKTQLTKKQIRICEAVAGNYGGKFGYMKTESNLQLVKLFSIFGINYGILYIYFIKVMYALPFKMRMLINYKVIYKNATFWKEVKNNYT